MFVTELGGTPEMSGLRSPLLQKPGLMGRPPLRQALWEEEEEGGEFFLNQTATRGRRRARGAPPSLTLKVGLLIQLAAEDRFFVKLIEQRAR